MQKVDGVWLILFLLLGYLELLLCKVHYIIPSEGYPCNAGSCLTLSQFAHNTTNYLDSNTTLILTGGRHILNIEVSVSNINSIMQQFSMLSTNNMSTIITCSESANLSFTNIAYVHIHNLTFIGCGSCDFNMVNQLTIEHSTFLNSSGTSIKVNGTNASITEMFFVSNTMGILKSSRDLMFFRYLQMISTLAYTQSLFTVRVGGAIITSHSTIAINNCMFEENSAHVGGAIFSEHGSNVTISNSEFFSNHATGCTYQFCTGGALLIDGSGIVIVHNSTFKNNTSDQDGGMAALFDAKLFISHSIVSNNTATRYGGAIATVSSSLGIDNGRLEYNSAETGGGVISSYESNTTIINNTYLYNSVQTDGGVIYTKSSCNIVINNCTFINNSATGNGGVLYIETENSVTVRDSIIHDNTANFGGYIFASDVANISVNRSTFMNNAADTRGGVIYLIKNSSITVNGSTFAHNRADIGGGVISVKEFGSFAAITACNFSDNMVNIYGGVADITDGGGILVNDSIFHNNTAGDDGSGGVFNGYSMSNIKIYRSIFTHNRAKIAGGAVSIRQGGKLFAMNCMFHNHSGVDLGAVIHAFQGTDTIIRDCYFSQNSALFGGVLTMVSYNNMTIDNSVFYSNAAKIDGGVFYLRTWCRVVIKNNCLFNNNIASHDGIVLTTDNSFVTIESTTFSDNIAGHDGGCLYVNENSAVVLNGSNLTRNYASNSGGIVYGLRSSNITVDTSRIDGNAAQNSGGVIHAQQDSNVTINASNFTNNTADYGGVLRVYVLSIANITSSMFAGNMAKVGGGAMAVYESSILSVYASEFNYNKALSGGVIYAFQNTFEDNRSIATSINIVVVTECNLWNNTANYGGVLNTEHSSVTIKSTYVHQNRAIYIGGGIYASGLSTFNIDTSNFTSNTAEDNAGVMALIGGSIVNVTNSFFTGNVATNRGGVVYLYQSNASILNGTFISSLAGQNGGVIYVLLHSTIRIDNSSLTNNTANKLGGVISSSLGGNLIVLNCKFTNNSASSSGGALHITDNSSATIVDSNFRLNRAQHHGGAITTSNLSDVTITGGSSLSQNTAQNGAALAVEETSHVLFYTFPLTSNNITERTSGEIIIHNNTAIMSGGGIYLKNSYFYIGMETNISYNQVFMTGGGIHAANSLIDIESAVYFDSNQATSGGGISLADSKLSQGSDQNMTIDINFVSNIAAEYGGAIYVDDEQDISLCSSGLDPYPTKNGCFFQNVTNSLTFSFYNNSANLRGYDLFGGLLDRCTVASDIINISRLESYGTTHFANISNISQQFDTVSSEPVRVCHCVNNKPSCGRKIPPIQVKNGNDFNVSVAAVDQVNHIVASTVYSSFPNLSSSNGQTIHKVDARCSHLIYRMSFSQSPKEFELLLYADGPCRDTGISKLSISVLVLSCLCPYGFMRSNDNSACVCVCDKRDKIFTTFIQECDSSSESVIRKGRFWITYFNDSDNSSSPYFIYPYCPLDYCQPLTNSIPVNLNQPNGSDAQCANNRSGLLCGRCKPAYSLSLGSSSCIKCYKNWYGLFLGIIIAGFIAGIIFVILLLMLNITVAVGSLNSIIFYANIIYANRSIYFSVSYSEPVNVFISWLNLEIGIDTCFYNGMDTYAKTWIQLAFPIYMIFLVLVVIWVSSCSIKLSNLLGRRNPVATLATLILISYTKLLETVIASFSFVSLRYPDDATVIKWLPDASVEYGKGKHVALICVAIVILVAGLLYTIIIFSWQWLLRCQKSVLLKWTRNLKFHSFVSTYHTPHTAKHRYWTGMLLLVRVIVYLISAFSASVDPRIALLATVITISCLLVYKAMFLIRAYKNWVLNVLESYVYVNIVLFTSITLYTFDDINKETLQTICAYISAGTVFILFLLVIAFHVYRFSSIRLFSLSQKSKLGRKVNTLLSNNQDISHQISLESSILDAIDTSRAKFGSKPDLQLNSGPTSSTVSMTDCAESPTVECSQPQDKVSGDKVSLSLQQHDDNRDIDSEQNKRSASITDSGIISESCSVVVAERTMLRKSKPKLLKFGSFRKSNKSITEPLLEEDNL